MIDDWVKDINITDILKDRELYVTVRDRAYRIFCRNGIPFKEIEQELCLSQEEADTKFFWLDPSLYLLVSNQLVLLQMIQTY